MSSIVKKRFDISITSPDKVFSQSFELDKNITFIKGILLTSDKEDLLYYRGSQKIEVNKQEVFPENYESKLLMTGINVSPNLRYYNTGNLPVGNGIVKVSYQDINDTRMNFEPYRVSVYLDCEQVEI
ncbi:hypothetical protein ACE38W_00900 [Chitinophaga sp. Hz27]|uniref:hypothetical protein n=1 Tax=Chitinophaga sp. Hz27 TaxID=3347169 RepID=UPI0035E2ECA2